jgi:hypothetical protein
LWPCAIDVAIAQATLCLLSLSRRRATNMSAVSATRARSRPYTNKETRQRTSSTVSDAATPNTAKREASPDRMAQDAATAATDDLETITIGKWKPVAETLVQQGVTSKDPALVATILAQHEAGMPPSTIGRTFNVHHTTVGRILSALEDVAG